MKFEAWRDFSAQRQYESQPYLREVGRDAVEHKDPFAAREH